MVVECELNQDRRHFRIHVGVYFTEVCAVKPHTVLIEPLLEKSLLGCQDPVMDKIRELDAAGRLFAFDISLPAIIVAVINIGRDPLTAAGIRVKCDVKRIIVSRFVFPCRVTASRLNIILSVIRRDMINFAFRPAEELDIWCGTLLPARL